jgi:predicted  nucleic acid-binding Zn-ribbon protein
VNIKTITALTKQLEKKKVALAKLRDELREIESEICSLAEDAEDAIDSLSEAIDALSRLV